MMSTILTRARSGHLDAHTPHNSVPLASTTAQRQRFSSYRAPVLQRAASAPSAVSDGVVALAAQHLKAPLEQAVDYSRAVLQAELAWVREQLERERSRSNSAIHTEQRRMMMELAHTAQSTNQLRSQVSQLEHSLKQAHATIAQQTKEMAVLGRAQALADWTSFAATRKRLMSSMEEVDAVTSRASQAERALQQEQSEKRQLVQELTHLKLQNEQLQSQCNLPSSSEIHGPPAVLKPCAVCA